MCTAVAPDSAAVEAEAATQLPMITTLYDLFAALSAASKSGGSGAGQCGCDALVPHRTSAFPGWAPCPGSGC
jgi:hypothetical protein